MITLPKRYPREILDRLEKGTQKWKNQDKEPKPKTNRKKWGDIYLSSTRSEETITDGTFSSRGDLLIKKTSPIKKKNHKKKR